MRLTEYLQKITQRINGLPLFVKNLVVNDIKSRLAVLKQQKAKDGTPLHFPEIIERDIEESDSQSLAVITIATPAVIENLGSKANVPQSSRKTKKGKNTSIKSHKQNIPKRTFFIFRRKAGLKYLRKSVIEFLSKIDE